VNDIKLWDWEKKKRTMLRYIKSGDIFCFQYDENIYCFGRIISRLDIGTVAEIFDYTSNSPAISKADIENTNRMFYPVNLDIYSLFDRKIEGEWRIIGHQENFVPTDADSLFFWYGLVPYYKIDVYGNQVTISEEETKNLQRFGFQGDIHIKDMVKAYLD